MLLFTLLTTALVVVSSTTTTPRTFLPVSSLTKGRDELPLGPSHDSTLALPTSFDSRTRWRFCHSITEIYDQSACGDCWAVSSVMTATDRWCIAKNQTENPRLSVEGAFLCCSLCSLSLLAFFSHFCCFFLCRLPLPSPSASTRRMLPPVWLRLRRRLSQLRVAVWSRWTGCCDWRLLSKRSVVLILHAPSLQSLRLEERHPPFVVRAFVFVFVFLVPRFVWSSHAHSSLPLSTCSVETSL